MSRKAMEAATEYAIQLPSFSSLSHATGALYRERDATIAAFLLTCGQDLKLDYSPESLKRIEGWYFQADCPERHLGVSVLHAIAFYLGEVLCRTAGFEWIVCPYAFDTTKFEIGVTRDNGSIMLSGGWRPPIRDNKRRQSLWREWKRNAL
jgi:hypothetical protein